MDIACIFVCLDLLWFLCHTQILYMFWERYNYHIFQVIINFVSLILFFIINTIDFAVAAMCYVANSLVIGIGGWLLGIFCVGNHVIWKQESITISLSSLPISTPPSPSWMILFLSLVLLQWLGLPTLYWMSMNPAALTSWSWRKGVMTWSTLLVVGV